MKRQSLIALGAALILGLVAVYLANIFLTASEKNAEPVGTARVAVAAVPLDYGVDLTPDRIRFVDFPLASIPPGSFRRLSDLLPAGQKRVALTEIQANEPILENKISGVGKNASIAALLPEGKRAAAVRINDVSGVAGFIQPNDSVDVVVTRQMGDTNQQVADILLQNVRVIAIDQDAKGADGKPALAKTATLEVDQLSAQKLALAQQIGSLSLVLRKPGENQDNPVVETVSLNDLRYSAYGGVQYPAAARIGALAAPAPRPIITAPVVRTSVRRPPPARPRPAASGNSIEIVRGTERSNYQVGGYGK